jgi:hypothetical protein
VGAWALGEPRSHIAGLTGLHSANGPLEGRTVGVMLRLTPIEDPKNLRRRRGQEDTPSPDTPSAPQGEENPGGKKR